MTNSSESRRKPGWQSAGRRAAGAAVALAALLWAAPRAQAQPINDNFANATVLVGASGSIIDNNFGATREAGEPLHMLGLPTFRQTFHSVWYQWTALTNGIAIFNTIGFPFDSVMAVYTGSSLPTLSLVANDDDGAFQSAYPFDSQVVFNAAGGTVYSVAVDSWSAGFTGTFGLNWFQSAATNQPPPPSSTTNVIQFQATTFTVNEGSPGFATINVVFTGGGGGEVSVDFFTSDGTAFDGADYLGRSGTLTFTPGVSNLSFNIPILDNAFGDGDRVLNLSLANPVGAPLGVLSNAVLTILDDEAVPFVSSAGRFEFSASFYRGTENETFFPPIFTGSTFREQHIPLGIMITVNRVGGSTGRVLVDYRTVDPQLTFTNIIFTNFLGLALPGVDYTAVSNTLVFDHLQTSTNFLIPTLNFGFFGISNIFSVVTVPVELSNPRAAPGENPKTIVPTLGTITNATVQIAQVNTAGLGLFTFERFHFRGDEYDQRIGINILRPAGGAACSVDLVFDFFVGLTEIAGNDNANFDVARQYQNSPYSDGSLPLVDPADMDGDTIRVQFGDGQTRATAFLPVFDDNLVEFNEEVFMHLEGVPGCSGILGIGGVAVATIVSDDQAAGALDREWNPDEVFNTDLPFNTTPGANNVVNGVAVTPDGRTVVVGEFTAFNSVSRNGVARANADGSLDLTFQPGTGVNGLVSDVAVYAATVTNAADIGKTVLAGAFTSFNGISRVGLARLDTNGAVDPTFNPGIGVTRNGQPGTARSVAIQSDGKVLIVGDFTHYDGVERRGIARVNPDGSLDPFFNPGTGADGTVWSVALLETSPPLLVGAGSAGGPAEDINVVDAGGRQGTITIDYNFYFVPDSIRVYYEGQRILDTGFTNGSGRVTAAFNGQSTLLTIIANEGSGLFGTIWDYTATIQTTGSDKKLMIGGEFTSYNGVAARGVARINPSGSLDFSFNPGGGPNGPVYAVAGQSDNKVLVGGSFDSFDLRPAANIARLNVDGSFDTTYNAGSGTDDSIYTIEMEAGNRALIGGPFTRYNQTRRIGLARLLSSGAVDTTFLDTAYNQFAGLINEHSFEPRNFVRSIALQADGNVIIGGSFTNSGGTWSFTRQEFSEAVIGERDTWTRQMKRARFNVARLIGGITLGPGNLEYFASEFSQNENAGFLAATVRRVDGRVGTVQIDAVNSNRTASAGQDFVATKETLVWIEDFWGGTPYSVGDVRSNYFRVPLLNDELREGDEILDLGLVDPVGSITLGGEFIPLQPGRARALAPLTLLDDDFDKGVINFSDVIYRVNEGTNAVITVIRTNGNNGPVTVDWFLRNGTALAGIDFTNFSGSLTFASGQTTNFIVIELIHDTAVEIDESFFVILTNATGGASLPGPNGTNGLAATNTVQATVTIIDDDFGAGRLNFAETIYRTNEAAGVAQVLVRRLNGSSGFLTVQAAATNGSAVAGSDFTGVTNTLTWNAGDIEPKILLVPLMNDNLVETNETIQLRLFNPSVAGALGGLSTATLIIEEDDSYGRLAFSQVNFDTDEDGTNATITVVRQAGLAGTVSVDYRIRNGTALSGQDYLGTDGTLTFLPGEFSKAFEIAVLDDPVPDGNKTVVLQLTNFVLAGPGTPGVATLTIVDDESQNIPAGSLDTSFNPGAGANNAVYAAALQPDGRYLIAGDFQFVNGVSRNRIARLFSNGLLDGTYNAGRGPNRQVRALALQPDGKAIIGGFFDQVHGTNLFRIARVNTDGTVDLSFNPGAGADNPVLDLAVGPDRRIVVGGQFTKINNVPRSSVAVLNTNGTVHADFNPRLGTNDAVYAVAVQPDGRILIGGEFTTVDGVPRPYLARLLPNGALDPDFDPGAGPDGPVRALAVQPDGRVLVGGAFTAFDGQARFRLARVEYDGTLDGNFQTGLAGANDTVNGIRLQDDGTILVVGAFTSFNDVTRNRITRLYASGKTDPTINFGDGANAVIYQAIVQPDRKILIVGGFTQYDGQPRAGVARIHGGSIAGPGSIEFSVPEYRVAESGLEAVVAVRRSGGTSGESTADYLVLENTALANLDYTNRSGTLIFPEGEVRQVFTVPLVNDVEVEPEEFADLVLTNFTGGAVAGPQPVARLIIESDDSVVGFAAASFAVNESEPSGRAVITVVRTGSTLGSVTVDFSTAAGTATADPQPDADYSNVVSTVTFLPGETVKTVTVPILTDGLVEGNETVLLSLDNITSDTGNLLAGLVNAVLNIVDDDFSPGRVSFLQQTYAVNEYETNAVITVIRTNGRTGLITVSYNTADGTARQGQDYLRRNGTLSFADGETLKTFTVPIIPDFNVAESNETVFLTLSGATGGAIVGPIGTAQLVISNNNLINGSLNFTATNFTEIEGNLTVLITVSRLFGGLGAVSVGYRTIEGSASNSVDFTATSNVLAWADGDTADQTIVIPLVNDAVVENTEFFQVELLNPTGGASLGVRPRTTVTILDDDFGPGLLGFEAAAFSVIENASNAVITVRRTFGQTGPASIDFATLAGGTAEAGSDYVPTNGTLIFGDGETVKTFAVAIVNNFVTEGNTTVWLGLSNPVLAATNGQNVFAVLTIVEDEPQAGSIDNSFSAEGANGPVNVIAIQTNNNRLWVGGGFTSFGGLPRTNLARLNLSGTVDTMFDPLGALSGPVRALVVDPDGRGLAGGAFTNAAGQGLSYLVRFATDGGLDTNFLSGRAGADNVVNSIALQTDAKIVIGGAFTSVNGTNLNRVARLLSDGAVDPAFTLGGGANDVVWAVAVAPSGRIYVAGDFTQIDGQSANRIARLDGQGRLDPGFNAALGPNASVRAVVVQPDGLVLIGGLFTDVNGIPRNRLVRLNDDGSVDGAFSPGTGANEFVSALALQPDGRILAGGGFTEFDGVSRNYFTRLNPDGTLDYTFNIGSGANNFVSTVAVQADRKIVVGGGFTRFNRAPRNRIARLNGGENLGFGSFVFSATNYTALEGGGFVTVTVERRLGTSNTVSVAFETLDGTATAPAHYQQTNGVLVFGPGETLGTFDVFVVDDVGTNADRVLNLALSSPTGGAILGSTATATVTIANNDSVVRFATGDFTVSELGVTAVITVERLGSTVGDVSVNFATLPGTATAGFDFVSSAGVLFLSNGVASATFDVTIVDDSFVEGAETVLLELSNPTNYPPAGPVTIPQSTALLTIVDNETDNGVFQFSQPFYIVSERTNAAVITVQRIGGSSGAGAINFATANGTATAGLDYRGTNGVLVFADGESSKTFLVGIFDDVLSEGQETVNLTLSNPVGGVLLASNAVLTIDADEAVFSFDALVIVTNENATNALINVNRTGGGSGVVTVQFATSDGTATNLLDYVGTNRVLTFAPGVNTQTVLVPILDDALGEGDEFLNLLLFGATGEAATNVIAGTNAAQLVLLDDDVSFNFESGTYFVFEPAGSVTVNVIRTGRTNGIVSVQLSTSDGTALAGADYGFTNVTVVFADGQTSQGVSVAILNDALGENNETFTVNLLNPTNGTSVGGLGQAVVTILDDEDTLAFAAMEFRASENATNAVITVVRNGGSFNTVNVFFATTNGTATPNADYTNVTGLLTFSPFEFFKTFSVPIVEDALVEGDETVLLRLFNPAGGATLISPSNAVLVIEENDVTISFAAAGFTVPESGTNALIEFRRLGGTNGAVAATCISTNGSAAPGVDYAAVSNLVVFAPGQTNATLLVPIFDDVLEEGAETFNLRLLSPTNALLSSPSNATVTILDDDASIIVAAGAAITSESLPPANGVIDSNETVVVNFGLRNIGNLDTLNLVATLLASNGVTPVTTSQNYGAVLFGGNTVSRPFTFIASTTNGATLRAHLRLQDGARNLGTVTFTFQVGSAGSATSNNVSITINDRAPATPYPSTLTVSNAGGTVTRVTVTLRNLSHTFPDDLDILLVGPGGHKVTLMSDAGGTSASPNPLNNVTITFDDLATNALPDSNQIASLTYRPANYAGFGTADAFQPPAPAGPYTNTFLSVFNGVNPNGVWSLYVVDDTLNDNGNIAGGWTLNLTTTQTPLAETDLGIVSRAEPNPITMGMELTNRLFVTNFGPATASGVIVTSTLPASMAYVSSGASQGSCSFAGNVVTCNLGGLTSGGGAVVTVVMVPQVAGGTTSIPAGVAGNETDSNPVNNTASVKPIVEPLMVTMAPQGTNLYFYWTAAVRGCVLQQTTSLNPAGWAPVGVTPAVVNGSNRVVLPMPAGASRYYRLGPP